MMSSNSNPKLILSRPLVAGRLYDTASVASRLEPILGDQALEIVRARAGRISRDPYYRKIATEVAVRLGTKARRTNSGWVVGGDKERAAFEKLAAEYLAKRCVLEARKDQPNESVKLFVTGVVEEDLIAAYEPSVARQRLQDWFSQGGRQLFLEKLSSLKGSGPDDAAKESLLNQPEQILIPPSDQIRAFLLAFLHGSRGLDSKNQLLGRVRGLEPLSEAVGPFGILAAYEYMPGDLELDTIDLISRLDAIRAIAPFQLTHVDNRFIYFELTGAVRSVDELMSAFYWLESDECSIGVLREDMHEENVDKLRRYLDSNATVRFSYE